MITFPFSFVKQAGSPTPPGGIVTDSLFMELDASDYTSGTWNDRTVNGNNATINGATWSSTDDGIFDLDGSNDNIQIPHKSQLSLSTTVQKTIQVWVKFDTLPGLNQQVPVFGKLSSSYAFDGYWGGLFSNTGTVRCTTNGSSIQRISTSTSTVTTNTWYLFTFISQITSTSNTTKVYINETEYITATHGTDGYSESNPLYLGYIGSGVSSLYLNGKIGACYFYTKGLSASEILQNYNATKTKYSIYNIESFTSVGTTSWTAPVGVTSVEYLVVGGGGGGGNGYDNGGGGGGGAGMVLTGTLSVEPGNSYTITVGAGGSGGADLRQNLNGSSGNNSVFSSITALGGGGGGGSRTGGNPGDAQVGDITAPTGGNGNGGGQDGDGGGGATGAGTAGGANPGTGGSGFTSTISGSSIIYGVGGNGGSNSGPIDGANGTINRGNGGGGGSSPSTNSASGGNGGSGIVILKY